VTNEILSVDPGKHRLPPSRSTGADPLKLQKQIGNFGNRMDGMPMPWVHRGKGGELMLLDGVTRATRIAKLCPGIFLDVLVTEEHPNSDYGKLPTVRARLP